jgi:hypothetical protein
MATMNARHLSVSIETPFAQAYAFLSNAATLPQWASGLGHSFEMVGPNEWTGEGATGRVTVYFSVPNEAGILDHRVMPDGGEAIFVPMRIVPNGSGAEITITLFQQEGMADAYFERDANTIENDLQSLKRILENFETETD